MTNKGDVVVVEQTVGFAIYEKRLKYKANIIDEDVFSRNCCCSWDGANQRVLCLEVRKGGGIFEIVCSQLTPSCLKKSRILRRMPHYFRTDHEGNLVRFFSSRGSRGFLFALQVHKKLAIAV